MLLKQICELANTELTQVEAAVDHMFRELGLDVIFTQHFKNRILDQEGEGRVDHLPNSDARDTDVTAEQVYKAFSALKTTYGKQLMKAKHNPEQFVGVLKDISTKLNIPFTIDYDKIYSGLHKLYASTIMRKANFTPNSVYDKVLKVKSNAS